MCGRFTLATPHGDLAEVFDVPSLDLVLPPRFNIAPGQEALVVGQDRRGRRMGMMRWGLPRRGGGPTSRILINARGESAWRTPMFRDRFLHGRCLVPADGFYEWTSGREGRTPFHFRSASGGVLALAGLWDRGGDPGGEPWSGFVILTVAAGPDVSPVHERMPLPVASAERDAWLDPATPLERVRALVVTPPAGTVAGHAVSARVNRVTEDDAGLVEPA